MPFLLTRAVHKTGDEVNTDCWTKSPEISEWMAAQNYSASSAYLYFVQRYQALARSMGRQIVGWDEIWQNFGASLDPSTIIAVWTGNGLGEMKAMADAGYRTLFEYDPTWCSPPLPPPPLSPIPLPTLPPITSSL